MRRWLILFLLATKAVFAQAQEAIEPPARIIALAPHLTEWVYLLSMQQRLVGVSAYSDYPESALTLPIVADANGVNFKAIMALEPDAILVWEGGNKAQDIARLASLGFSLFRSKPTELADIGNEISLLGHYLGAVQRATQIQTEFKQELSSLRTRYAATARLPVFFYMWTKPLMTVGANAWSNKALTICNAHSIFDDAPSDYPEVRLAEVIVRQPKALITTLEAEPQTLAAFWQPHRKVINAPIIGIDGSIINRFTPRIVDELASLCSTLHKQS